MPSFPPCSVEIPAKPPLLLIVAGGIAKLRRARRMLMRHPARCVSVKTNVCPSRNSHANQGNELRAAPALIMEPFIGYIINAHLGYNSKCERAGARLL